MSRHRWRTWALRALTLAFFALVVALLVSHLERVDWEQVGVSLRQLDGLTLAAAAGLTVLSYAIHSSLDLFGRAYTGHAVPPLRVLAIAFVSYAFNLNLGTWIGGIGFRYRLYSRFGLSHRVTGRILGMSILTNWLGYAVLAGLVFGLGLIRLPPSWWEFGARALQVAGLALLAVAAAYVAVCTVYRGRTWKIHHASIATPSPRMALAQIAVATLNWLVIASVLYVLLRGQVDFPLLLGVLMLSSVAGVIAHIPAGLGVIEAVFLGLLGRIVDPVEIVAALLAFRAIFYLVPLTAGLVAYASLEGLARRAGPAHA